MISETRSRANIKRELPHAQFPEWVARRRHGVAGAFLFGQIEQGWRVHDAEHGALFEPDVDTLGWDADLVDGVLRWRTSS